MERKMGYKVVNNPDGTNEIGRFSSFEDAILYAVKTAKKQNRESESYLHAGLDADGVMYFFCGACPPEDDGSYWPRVIIAD